MNTGNVVRTCRCSRGGRSRQQPRPPPRRQRNRNNRGHRTATNPSKRSDTKMPNVHPQPILNATLPAQFRQIRIELARELATPKATPVEPMSSLRRSMPTTASTRRCGESIARHAGSRGYDRTRKTSTVISFTVKVAAGRSITPTCRTRSDFTSRTSVSWRANMSRSTRAARCTPTAWYRCRACK